MFAAEFNIIPHFETMCSIDQGTDVNPMVQAALRIVKNAMDARKNPDQRFEFYTNDERKLLNGFQISTCTGAPDFVLCDCCDLHSYSFTKQGAEWIIDWLAERTKNLYWYAQTIIAEQAAAAKKRRRRKSA